MFRLSRFFSVASLVALVLVTLVLTWFYRLAAIDDLFRVEQQKNVAVTHTFANFIWPDYAAFFHDSAALSVDELRASPQITSLDTIVQAAMHDNGVVKVKIYALDGRTIYSSQYSQIGEDQSQNEGWLTAVNGQIANELTYRDAFNAFDGVIENRHVLASYVPLRRNAGAPVEAVFELYSDVTGLVQAIDRVQLNLVGGVVLVLGLLYAVQLLLVRHAERVIRQQYAERARAERDLRRRVDLDELIIRISTHFAAATNGESDRSIALALGAVGETMALSSVIAATLDSEGNIDSITIWSPTHTAADSADVGAMTWLRTHLDGDAPMLLRDSAALPVEAAAERRFCAAHNLHAVLFRPLPYGHDSIGFLALAAADGQSLASQEMRDLSAIVADLVATALVKRRTDLNLAASEERMRTLVRSMNDVVFTVDLAGCYTGFYGRGLAEFGFDPVVAVGKRPVEIFDPTTANLHDQAIAQALRGENVVFTWELMAQDGRQTHMQTSLSPVWNGAESVTGAVGVGRDISELKQLERAKSEFIANVNHELRTPLASILGYTELLLRGRPGPLTQVQQEFLQIISDGSRRLKLLVDDLLDVSRIEVGTFRMRFDDLDIEEVARRGIETVNPFAAKANVRIEVDLPPDLPVIEGDEERIGQVFDNLLSNAVKFSHAGGNVWVAITEEDTHLCVSVRDEGIGIPQEDLPFLFTRFYRAGNADPNQRNGTGLGLYIAKAIVEGHGGHIAAESQPGHGATLRFCLPKVQASPLDVSPDQLVKEIVDRYFST